MGNFPGNSWRNRSCLRLCEYNNCFVFNYISYFKNVIDIRLSTSIHVMINFDQLAQSPRLTTRKFSINWRKSLSATQPLRRIRNSLHGSIELYSIGVDRMLKVLTATLTQTVGLKKLYCKWMVSTLTMTTTTPLPMSIREDSNPVKR